MNQPQPIGSVRKRDDRPERLALYLRHDTLSNTFGSDQNMEDVRRVLEQAGYRLDDDGMVWAR